MPHDKETMRSSAESLLADAKLVFDYAVRAGRLPDASLPKSIEDAESALAEQRVPDMLALATSMNQAVAAIAPVTLLDLRMGRSPFNMAAQRAARYRQYGLCVITAMLAALICYYSIALHRQEAALREIKEIQNARVLEKITALRKLVQHDEVLVKRDSRYDQYQQILREIRDVEARRRTTYYLLSSLAEGPDFPFQRTLEDFVRTIADTLGGTATRFDNVAASEYGGQAQSKYDLLCDDYQAARKAVLSTRPAWLEGMNAESIDEYCFLQKLDLGFGAANYDSPFDWVSTVQDKIVLQSTWILPLLSGLFGAAIFLLRDALDPRTPSIGTTPAVVRIAMGGVAGIVIGWFWAPTGMVRTDLAVISSVPMGLAFLTGFSIDILFSMLDRLKRSITDLPATSARAQGEK